MPVYSYMETSFISLTTSCLNGQETKLRSISYTWSRMSMSFTSFSCSNIVKSPFRSAISAFSQLGHEVTPKYSAKNLVCFTCFRTNLKKANNHKSCFLILYFSSWVQNILNLLITVILESDLTSVALVGNVLFNLPFTNFPLYCPGFLDSATNARRCSRTDLKSDELYHFYHQLSAVWNSMLHLINLTFPLLWKAVSIQVCCLLWIST